MTPINAYLLISTIISYVFLVLHGRLKGTWTDFGNHFTSLMVAITMGWLLWPLFILGYLVELHQYQKNHRDSQVP